MSDEKHEIVIIRRGGHGDHDEHHGGVWKIAFADFMTAMMAFFLVMWLIAANDKTRATIARYFNPVKLVDATVRKQGLHDPKMDDTTTPSGVHDSEDVKGSAPSKEPGSPPAGETPNGRETRLDVTMRSNPLAALAEIAGNKGTGEGTPKDIQLGSAPVIGRHGGMAFRDPFAPPPPQVDADDKDADPLDSVVPPSAPHGREMSPPPALSADAAKPSSGKEAAKLQKKNDELAKEMLAQLKTPGHENDGPDIKVRKTNEGYLVSLTDTADFSMFSNGSAVPSRRVVLLMDHVAKVLAAKPGGIVVRGYTDNKPFKSGRYDNWNLSVDRAQAAHYMLVRGGLTDTRIASVEGFADHGTNPGVDPSSPLNRRIEILVKDDVK